MTFPEGLPTDVPPDQDRPSIGIGNVIESPLLPSQLRIFRIGTIASTHFDPTTCVALDCPEYLYGFRVSVDSGTALGLQQVSHIQSSGRTYTSWWEDDNMVTFLFPAGQEGLRQHWARNGTAPNWITVDTDGAPQSFTALGWVAELNNHLNSLATIYASIDSTLISTSTRRRIPQFVVDGELVVPPGGYEIRILDRIITPITTAWNLRMPLDTVQTTTPYRFVALSDWAISITGIRDVRFGQLYRSVSTIGARWNCTLQAGQRLLDLRCTTSAFHFARPAPNLVIWRLTGLFTGL